MTKEEFLHIECDLFRAVAAFHDMNDEEKRKEFIKNYTLNFCKEHNLNPLEVIDYLKELFENQRISDPDKYERFKKDSLNDLILGE